MVQPPDRQPRARGDLGGLAPPPLPDGGVGSRYELRLVPMERSGPIADHDLAVPATRTQRDPRHAVPRRNERHRQLLPTGDGRGAGSAGLFRAPRLRVRRDRDRAAHRDARTFGARTRNPTRVTLKVMSD